MTGRCPGSSPFPAERTAPSPAASVGVGVVQVLVQEDLLLRGEPARPVQREVDRYEQRAAGDRELAVVEELVVAGEGGGADAGDPDLHLQRFRVVDDPAPVGDLVRGDDDAAA